MIPLQPLDVVVVDALWYMPHHWPIRWRGMDRGVHCLTVISPAGTVLSPEFAGIKLRDIGHYRGRRVSVHRYLGELDRNTLLDWLPRTVKASRGYDFRQWLMGGVLGLTNRKWADASDQWTCAELPYWLYQDNGYRTTPRDEVLPMPRHFRYNPDFVTVFDGILE